MRLSTAFVSLAALLSGSFVRAQLTPNNLAQVVLNDDLDGIDVHYEEPCANVGYMFDWYNIQYQSPACHLP
ncbi:hypothetical protein NUW54_g9950 [Trametes sanguinea]|uniref:Uncharacterized protein n=1 Tax=Trametes sanguinea TaxID=158606 RepID=A0ACC1P446_9APHY|nr:hypothetical protein NUW54_g9950 [Trametes sanguinea]